MVGKGHLFVKFDQDNWKVSLVSFVTQCVLHVSYLFGQTLAFLQLSAKETDILWHEK